MPSSDSLAQSLVSCDISLSLLLLSTSSASGISSAMSSSLLEDSEALILPSFFWRSRREIDNNFHIGDKFIAFIFTETQSASNS